VCDRCGKEWFGDEEGPVEVHNVEFMEDFGFKHVNKQGQICKACLTEFWELANNFFDEVNKGEDDEQRKAD
jgi:hypothetical protein